MGWGVAGGPNPMQKMYLAIFAFGEYSPARLPGYTNFSSLDLEQYLVLPLRDIISLPSSIPLFGNDIRAQY